MNYHYYNYVSRVISEVNYSRFDRGRHQRRDVTPEEIGAKDHHFLDTNDPAKHVGKLAITRALANPQATGGNHPYASDIGQLHALATHYERKMSDAEMYLNNHPLADKKRYKSAAHARSSFNKWAGHLHALHSDVLRAYHHANQQGHGLPKDFKGLDQSHVEDHAQKRGIDISQPFDADAFKAKVRDFARHEVLVGDTSHPLYQGWKAPAKSPKGNAEEAAKQARMPEPPKREDASRNESITMKNNSQYRKDVKALFEANLRTYDQKRVDELLGTLALGGLAGYGAVKGYNALAPKARELYQQARKSPFAQDIVKPTIGAIKKGWNKIGGWKGIKKGVKDVYDKFKPKEKPVATIPYSKDVKFEKKEESSNHFRIGLKALFEAVLEEQETPAQKRAGDILQSDAADKEVGNLSPAELKKLQGAVNIRTAMIRNKDKGGDPSGRMSGDGPRQPPAASSGNPRLGSRGTDRRRGR